MRIKLLFLVGGALLLAGCAREINVPAPGPGHPAAPGAVAAPMDYRSTLTSGPAAPVPGELELGGHGAHDMQHNGAMSHGEDEAMPSHDHDANQNDDEDKVEHEH